MKNTSVSLKIRFRAKVFFLLFSASQPNMNVIPPDTIDACIRIEGSSLDRLSHAQLFIKDLAFFEDVSRNNKEYRNRVFDERAVNTGGGRHVIRFPNVQLPRARYAEINCYISQNCTFNFEFIMEPGDSITLHYTNGLLRFNGNNTAKYKCQERIQKILYSQIDQKYLDKIESIHTLDSCAILSLNVLESYKSELTEVAFMLMKTSIIQMYEGKKNEAQLILNGGRSPIEDKYLNPIWNETIINDLKSTILAKQSIRYTKFLVNQYEVDSSDRGIKRVGFKSLYQFITKNLRGPAREWAISDIVRRHHLDSEDGEAIEECINEAINLQYIRNDSVRSLILEYCESLIPGKKAFNFSLEDIEGKKIRLSDFLGKVVLLDFYTHPCGACRSNYKIIDSLSKYFSPKEFVVIAIFSPGSKADLPIWKKLLNDQLYSSKHSINVIDENVPGNSLVVTRMYKVSSFPTLLLVDKDGCLIGSPIMPNVDNGTNLNVLIRNNL